MTERSGLEVIGIRGSGGDGKGGSAQRSPVESPDSLRSKAFACVLDLVSEGPIKGPTKPGFEWVYFDDVPVENPDGSLNFKDVSIGWALGTQTQSYIPGFSSVESETVVSTEVKCGNHIVRTVNDPYIDSVRVTMYFPSMSQANTSNGDIYGTSVNIAIDIQTNGAGYKEVINDTVTGKTTTGYERSYIVSLPKPGSSWDIRVRRITADSSSSALNNKSIWARYTLISDMKLSYPNSAVVGVMIDAEQFQNIPTRGYELDLILCRIPSNYDPYARTYTGNWDGTWKIDWTNNPVWCTYDFITNTRYGCGRRLNENNLDKWALYSIAQYCDVFVASGKKKRASATTGSISLQAAQIQATVTGSIVFSTSLITKVNTITRSSGSWITDGFAIGDTIFVTGTTSNNGFYTILTKTDLFITVRETVTAETAAACSIQNSRKKNQYVRSTGSFITDGFKVADEVVVAGFTIGTNNGRGVVSDVTASTLTVEERTLTNEAAASGRSITIQDPTEPRFTCNTYWQTADNAYRTISAMASIFRANVYWGNNMLQFTQDAPKSASIMFTNSNVVGGKFTYSGAGTRATHTVALVDWIDPSLGYKPNVEYVEDPAGIALYGINPLKIPGVGCTSQGQAHRFGMWALYTERMEPELVTFESGFEAGATRPGEIIKIADNDRIQINFGGRVQACPSTTSITLDSAVTLAAGITYTLSVMLADGSIADRTIVNPGAGSYSSFTLQTALPSIPLKNAIWLITSTNQDASLWRVISVTDKRSESEIKWEVVAMLTHPEKYDLVENNLLLQTYGPSWLSQKNPPTGVTIGEFHIATAKGVKHMVTVGWTQQTGARNYSMKWRRNAGEWTPINDIGSPYYEFEVPEPGLIEISVVANYIMGQSVPTFANYTMTGKDTQPNPPSGLTATITKPGIVITWTESPDSDVIAYEIRCGSSSSTWATATVIASYFAGNRILWEAPSAADYKIYVAAIDSSGNISNAQWVTTSYGPTTPSSLGITVSNTPPA